MASGDLLELPLSTTAEDNETLSRTESSKCDPENNFGIYLSMS